jgi:YidC/Oxa1 family membrane protein insertase
MRVVFTNEGAGIRELELRYPDPGGEAARNTVRLLSSPPKSPPHLAVKVIDPPVPSESILWKPEEAADGSIEYSLRLTNGVLLRKRFELDPEGYHVRVSLWLELPKTAEGAVPADVPVRLELQALHGLEHDSPYRYEQYFRGVVMTPGGRVEFLHANVEAAEKKGDRKATTVEHHKSWFGLKNRFFAAVIRPVDEKTENRLRSYTFATLPGPGAPRPAEGLKNLAVTVQTDSIAVPGGGAFVLGFDAFFGPLREDALRQLPQGTDLIDYGSGCFLGGIVRPVGRIIVVVLRFFGGLVGNYGVAIILTTLLIRCCVFPLSKKSQVSLWRMQQLGPKIQVIRERYKDDQQKAGLEQMRLFRENKVSPLSGCLPMFLQLPVFIAMFSVFDISIELRQAPFFGWVDDLARPDELLKWKPFTIPLLLFNPTIDALNLLPLLMMGITFWQASTAPKSPDPQMQAQQRMMMFMMPLLGLICYDYASGLSLYFIVNSLLAMGEQKMIKRFFIRPLEEKKA